MIKVYSKENCSKCRVVKMFLKSNGIDFQEVDITNDDAERERLKSMNVSSMPYVENPVENFTGVRMDILNKIKEAN